jgi:NAD(P)-dependent dehydrogenase (short-subunit alcohol dehydrogenase family)
MKEIVATAVKAFGGLDIAVLNAGVFGDMATVTDYSEEMFDRVISINLKAVWHGVRAAIPEMRKRGKGSIVITSSTQGLSGYYLSSPYTASKHGVVGIMRNAAVELAKENIRVNTVHPGLTDTQMMGRLRNEANPDSPSAVMDAFAQAAPIGRYAHPREIAQMMLFLGSDEASYCTGGCYVVDGGLLAYHGGPAPA